jgi:hypothetical protein
MDAAVVEAHAIDDRLLRDESKKAWLIIACLWAWGDGADLDETKAKATERVDGVAFFIETGRKTDAVRKRQAHDLMRSTVLLLGKNQPENACTLGGAQCRHRQEVSRFCVERKKQRTKKLIHADRLKATHRLSMNFCDRKGNAEDFFGKHVAFEEFQRNTL